MAFPSSIVEEFARQHDDSIVQVKSLIASATGDAAILEGIRTLSETMRQAAERLKPTSAAMTYKPSANDDPRINQTMIGYSMDVIQLWQIPPEELLEQITATF